MANDKNPFSYSMEEEVVEENSELALSVDRKKEIKKIKVGDTLKNVTLEKSTTTWYTINNQFKVRASDKKPIYIEKDKDETHNVGDVVDIEIIKVGNGYYDAKIVS